MEELGRELTKDLAGNDHLNLLYTTRTPIDRFLYFIEILGLKMMKLGLENGVRSQISTNYRTIDYSPQSGGGSLVANATYKIMPFMNVGEGLRTQRPVEIDHHKRK